MLISVDCRNIKSSWQPYRAGCSWSQFECYAELKVTLLECNKAHQWLGLGYCSNTLTVYLGKYISQLILLGMSQIFHAMCQVIFRYSEQNT